MNKDVKFFNNGNPLNFDIAGYAINPDNNNAFFGADHRDLLITVVGTGNVLVLGSAQKLPPDFSSPSTITNSWVYITTADYSIPATFYAGNAGVTVSASTKLVELDTNELTWVAIFRTNGEGEGDIVDVLLTETNAQ